MATPMTAEQQLDAFRRWEVPFREVDGWRTRNRNHMGPWGGVNGLMVHHTGSDSSNQVALLRDGRSDLPGPLAQWGLAQDGVLWLIGNGRCNHAGKGDPDVLNAVINENYGDYPPTDNQATVDGNTHFYGVEIWYSGTHGMTKSQYSTLLRLGVAIIHFHGWTEKSVIGHGEWQPGKWDPGYANGKMMDMNAVRNDIADVKAGLDANVDGERDSTTPPPSIPETPQPRIVTVTTGDTIVFPGGGKVEVK